LERKRNENFSIGKLQTETCGTIE